MFKKLCFITTCKGRLTHLRQTAPLMIAQPCSQLVLVDWACPEGSGDWIEQNLRGSKVVRILDDGPFHLSRARNLGFAHTDETDGDCICFIDADTMIRPEFSSIALGTMRKGTFLIMPKGRRGLGGVLVVSREEFSLSQHYDEQYVGYGREASDMRLALFYQGLRYVFLPPEIASPIDHGDDLRVTYYEDPDIRTGNLRNSERLRRKLDEWRARTGKEPPDIYFLGPE